MEKYTWVPPGKDCGLCNEKTCKDLIYAVEKNTRKYSECPYYELKSDSEGNIVYPAADSGWDIHGRKYDFMLSPLPGEISARKIIRPFRPDLVEKMSIRKGDFVIGRPVGAGCPVYHVLKVIEADHLSGLLDTWVVGPKISRRQKVIDIKAYNMIGFEGIANNIAKNPVIGLKAAFMPSFCMIRLNHAGLVNMVLEKSYGLHIRLEDIHIQ